MQYAPRAYEWMLDCKATDDGMTIAKSGHEKEFGDLAEWSWDKVHAFPVGPTTCFSFLSLLPPATFANERLC